MGSHALALAVIALGPWGLGVFPAPAPASATGAQAQDAQAPESELDKMLRMAREASPVVRPQAARRFIGLGTAAAARVREVTGGTPAGYAALGQDLIEVLGELPDDAVRGDLWRALEDRDFPWRPSAARTLAKTARAAETARFVNSLADPLATVRAAAVLGLGVIDDASTATSVRPLLADPDDRVRREAATLVDHFGDPQALWWLVEDLRREDRFFDLDTGKLARFDAARRLQARLGESLSFAPERSPHDPDNQAALAHIVERVTELAGERAAPLPDVAQAGGTAVDAAFGLEVRSCRRGELFLRWDLEGFLWVGTGNAEPFALSADASEALRARAVGVAAALGEQEFWGQPGCDAEVFYLPRADGGVRSVRVSKGPEAVRGLRPPALAELATALLESIPVDDLRARAAATLDAVGGPLSDE